MINNLQIKTHKDGGSKESITLFPSIDFLWSVKAGRAVKNQLCSNEKVTSEHLAALC